MKKSIFILTTIVLVTFLVSGFINLSKTTTGNQTLEKTHKRDLDKKGIYHLHIISKNNAGWFHLNVLNLKDNSNAAAAPSDNTGYFPINTETAFPLILPNDNINELTPTYTVFRDNNGKGTPTRGGWSIKFFINCIGKDLVETRITPIYDINAKNYYDQLIKDENGNDGFKIYLINDFELRDTTAMLNKNIKEYNSFKLRTGRP